MAELQLEIELPNGKRLMVPLDRARTLRLGSHRECEVSLPYEGVQPLHCGVRWHQERFELIAAKQVQTVELNGKPVASAPLAANDRFTIGSLRVRVVAPGASTLQLAPLEEVPARKAGTAGAPEVPQGSALPDMSPGAKGVARAGAGDSQLGLAPLEAADHPTHQPKRQAAPQAPPSAPKLAGQLELAPLEEAEGKAAPTRATPAAPGASNRPTPPAGAAPGSAEPAAGKGGAPSLSAVPKWSTTPAGTSSAAGKGMAQPPKKRLPEQPAQQASKADLPLEAAKPVGSAPAQSADLAPAVEPATPRERSIPGATAGKPLTPAKPGSAKPAPHATPAAPSKTTTGQAGGPPKTPTQPSSAAPQAAGRSAGSSSTIDAFFDDALTGGADLTSLSFDEPSSPPAGTLGDPLAADVGMEPLGAAATAAAAPGLGQPAGKDRPRRTGLWLGVSAAIFAVLLLGGGGMWWLISRPSPEERLSSALAAYNAGRFADADKQLGRYLESYPHAPEGAKLRVKRAVARIKTLADGRKWEEYLRVCGEWLPGLALQAADEADREQLADVVLQSAEALTSEAAQGEGSEALLAQAQAALRLCGFLPLDGQQSRREEVERRFAGVRRQVSGGRALREAVEQLKRLAAAPGEGDPYAVRRALVHRYPELAASPELLAALQGVAERLAARVTFNNEVPSKRPSKAPRPRATVTFASSGAAAGTVENAAVVFCESHGTLYGLDPATGRLVWRRYVGDAALSAELPHATTGRRENAPPRELVLWDEAAGRLVRLQAANNKVVWESTLEGRAFSPVRLGDMWLVAQPSGRLLLFDHKTGTCQGAFAFPQQLACEPGIDPQRGRAYLLAEDSYLYVLDLNARRCVHAVYVGHAPGAAAWPPLLLSDRHLIVASDWGKTLKIYQVEQDRLSLRAQRDVGAELTDAPLVAHQSLWLATRIGVERCQIEDDSPQVLADGGRWKLAEHATLLPLLTPAADGVWVGGDGYALIRLPQAGTDAPGAGEQPLAPTVLADCVALRPLLALPDGALAVVARDKQAGFEAAAIDAAGQLRWQVQLAQPLVCPPVLDDQGATLRGADAAGRVYSISLATLAGDLVLDQPEMLLAEGRLPMTASVLGFEGGVWVAGWDRTLLSVSGRDGPRVQVELSARLVYPLVRWGDHVLALLEGGTLWVGDPKTLRGVASLGLDATGSGGGVWEFAAATGGKRLLLSDAAGRWWRCEWSAGAPGAVEAAELSAPPAWATVRPQWGPVLSGGMLIMAADDALLCAAPDGEVSWRYELAGRSPIGAAAVKGRLLVAFASGEVVELDFKQGHERAAWHTGEALAHGPLLTQRGVLVATPDGSLLLWERKEK